MSVYKPLDEGIPGEADVDDLPRTHAGHGAMRLPEPPRTPAARIEPHFRRKAAQANVPFAATFRWVASLPRNVRPIALLQQFPRIANILARAWGDPVVFREHMFELLIDHRGDRQGFPDRVRSELLALRAHFDETHPA